MVNNKIYLYFIGLIFLFTSNTSYSLSDTQKIDSSITYYNQGKYKKSIELFKELIEKNGPSAEIYYNIANCYYKTSNLGKAILYYEKSKKLDPFNEDLEYNIKVIQEKIKQNLKENETFVFQDNFKLFINKIKNSYLFISLLVVLLLSSIFLSLFLHSNILSNKKTFYRISVVTIILSVLLLITTHINYNNTINNKEGVIIRNETVIKSGPTKTSNKIIILHSGVKVGIIDDVDIWYKVKVGQDNIGWVEKEFVNKI